VPTRYITCPTIGIQPDGTPHTVTGCGARIPDIRDHEGLVDCPNCGMFFDPDQEPGSHPGD
jgi:hypothetical protein